MFLAILHQRNTIALSTEVNLNSLVWYLTWEIYYNCVNCRVFNVFFSLSHFLGLDCSQKPFFKINKHISICVLADTFGLGFHKWASLYTIFPDLHHSHILFCLSQLTLFAFSSLYICSRVFILPHLARSQSAVQFGEHL